jgi:hypothetical protein
MDQSTAAVIEAEAAWSRKPHHLSLPDLWQEIQREAREQLVRLLQLPKGSFACCVAEA